MLKRAWRRFIRPLFPREGCCPVCGEPVGGDDRVHEDCAWFWAIR